MLDGLVTRGFADIELGKNLGEKIWSKCKSFALEIFYGSTYMYNTVLLNLVSQIVRNRELLVSSAKKIVLGFSKASARVYYKVFI